MFEDVPTCALEMEDIEGVGIDWWNADFPDEVNDSPCRSQNKHR